MMEDIEIDICPQCEGAWFDEDELRKAKDVEIDDLQWLDFEIWKHEDRFQIGEASVKCPACRARMARLTYENTDVEVDACPDCRGVWLDGGEFEKIIATLDAQLNTMSAGQYLAATIREGAEIVAGPERLVSERRDFKRVVHLMGLRIMVERGLR